MPFPALPRRSAAMWLWAAWCWEEEAEEGWCLSHSWI